MEVEAREAVILPWRLRLGRILLDPGNIMCGDVTYHIRTIIGFLAVITGVAGGLRLGWWLSTEGNIVEIIHRAKMNLPDWGWTGLKIGLSAVSAGLVVAMLFALAIAVFAMGGRK